MQEGYQIIELKNRVSDVLTQTSIKVSDVLTLLGQRCADSYQITINNMGYAHVSNPGVDFTRRSPRGATRTVNPNRPELWQSNLQP